MARKSGRTSVSVVLDHSLASFVELEDRRLDDPVDRAIGRSSSLPPPPRAKDQTARWAHELDVLRWLLAHGAPQARTRGLGGELGRSLARQAEGTSGISTAAKAYEPGWSDHHRAAWRAWEELPADEREILVLAFGTLDHATGGADAIARTIAQLVALDRAGEAKAHLPRDLADLDPKVVTRDLLLAMHLRRVVQTEEGPRFDVEGTKADVQHARRAWRDGLRRVELDIKPALLIPAASLRERDRERATLQRVCDGIVVTVDGVRRPCEPVEVVAETASWARCEACGLPRRAGR